MFLNYLHSTYDTRFFAIGVVEESQLAFLHRPQVVARGIRSDT